MATTKKNAAAATTAYQDEDEWVVYLRLPADYQARVDAHAARLRAETGLRVNQADALRSIVRLGVGVAGDDRLRREAEASLAVMAVSTTKRTRP
jgi:hypothetical protein